MTRAFESTNRRYLPEPSFPSSWPDDEHAFCVCGALMARDGTGELVCQDGCSVALDAAKDRAEVAS